MNKKHIYHISFINANTIYEIYARSISESNIHGFIEAEDFIFNTKSAVMVDPAEERLKNEFADVKRTYIPIHAIIRIDAVKKEGPAKIHELPGDKGKISHLPGKIFT